MNTGKTTRSGRWGAYLRSWLEALANELLCRTSGFPAN